MPRIFDNIDGHLLPALTQTMQLSDRADFCVGVTGRAEYWRVAGKEAVPELQEPVRYFTLRNRRAPYVSLRNCPDGFPKIVEALGASTRLSLQP